MAKKIRKNTVSVINYIDETMREDVRLDQEVQRMAGQWTNEMINELIYTTLTGDYIPPIILGEEEREDGTSQLWCIDGLQRTSSLTLFRYGNYKVTSSIRNSVVEYQRNRVDENGNNVRDESGSLVKDTVEYDIKNKKYDDLPEELKRVFDSYQIDTVIHQNCDRKEISLYMQRYNNHVSMGANQKAFTYAINIAQYIRNISSKNDFFKDCGDYGRNPNKKGEVDRVIAESAMTINHLDNWKSSPKVMYKFLDEHSSEEEVSNVGNLFTELYDMCDGKYPTFFNTKNTCVFMATYNEFKKLGKDITEFNSFLNTLEGELAYIKCGVSVETKKGIHETWAEIDEQSNTKDTKLIKGKIEFLIALMNKFLHISETNVEDTNIEETTLDFVRNNVDDSVEQIDVDAFMEDVDYISMDLENPDVIDVGNNEKALAGIIAYSYKNDITYDDWFKIYVQRKDSFIGTQKQILDKMIASLNEYMSVNAA